MEILLLSSDEFSISQPFAGSESIAKRSIHRSPSVGNFGSHRNVESTILVQNILASAGTHEISDKLKVSSI